VSEASESLQRLVSSGKCECCNLGEYIEELKKLAETVADRKEVKRRSRFFKALGDENRQRILSLLSAREMCVCELMAALKMTQPTTSHHLKILEDAEVVKHRKDGKWVFYSLSDPARVDSLLSLFA
jgi:DNA-binding transcriptional ArsR family regulator